MLRLTINKREVCRSWLGYAAIKDAGSSALEFFEIHTSLNFAFDEAVRSPSVTPVRLTLEAGTKGYSMV